MQDRKKSESVGTHARQALDSIGEKRIELTLVAALAAALFAAPGPAESAEVRTIGSFGKWRAHTFEDQGKKACYMTSQPVKDEGKYNKRGEIYVMVVHRPSDQVRDEVSFWAGYAFKDKSRVEVAIDGRKFEVVPIEEIAWAPDPESDRKLVAAMKAGNTMVVEGTSQRGTDTKDTYSLTGFTKAYNAMSRACN